MIVLDTNVLSELMRRRASPDIEIWLKSHRSADLYTTAITEAELRLGVALLPGGRRRVALQGQMDLILTHDFAGKILPFDSSAAQAFAVIAAARRATGRPISQPDAQIAAIALVHSAALATRNVRDFEGCGVKLFNPWDSA